MPLASTYGIGAPNQGSGLALPRMPTRPKYNRPDPGNLRPGTRVWGGVAKPVWAGGGYSRVFTDNPALDALNRQSVSGTRAGRLPAAPSGQPSTGTASARVTVDGYGNASAGDATQYEDYVDQGALASLIALARSNFDPVASQRLQSYVDPAELRRLQASARNEYQFDPESYQDDPAARASAFARAKEQIGLIGRASMNSLRNQFAARNLLGSGGEAVARGGVLAGAGSDLSNFATTQALDEATERSAVSARNAAGRQAMEARLSGLTPTFIAGATKQRYVPGDPTDVQNSINAYIQSLMPTLIAQSKRRRRLAE